VVLPRPQDNGSLHPKTADWVKTVEQTDKTMLKQHKNGCLFFAETPLWDVSSTQIRLRFNESAQMDNKHQQNLQQLLPQKVADYIKQHHLYDSTANSR
jgi:nicotinic acid mononucleotide adenylyltransferase